MKTLIFDLDGTLWDSREVVALAWNRAILEKSDLIMNIDVEMLTSLFGKPMEEISRILFPDLSDKAREALAVECYEYENRMLETVHGKLYPGVEETFKELKRDHELYIASNCQCGYIEVFLKTMELENYVKDHICFGDTNLSKGENLKILMKRNDINRKEAFYVGDTAGDEKAAMEAGLPFIFAEYGFGKAIRPYRTITGFKDLITNS